LTATESNPRTLPPLEVHAYTGGAFAENSYLVVSPASRRSVVVDPGAAAPELLAHVDRLGVSIDAIYLTHGHVDHVEGIPKILDHTSAPIHLHPRDLPLYRWAERSAIDWGINLRGVLPDPDYEIMPGEPLAVGDHMLQVSFTPGHAPGHVIFYSKDSGLALVGDVIFKGSIGRTDLPGGDYRQLFESIRREILTLPDDTLLLSGHGPETTVRDERLGNPFLISQAAGRFA
jgi:glyoxylase-like metal-dependent hydrolase (beta-lactamase superfamily II)